MMKQWFESIPNDEFTDEFQRFMAIFLGLMRTTSRHSSFVDMLLDDDLDTTRLYQETAECPWLYLTLLAACYQDSPTDAQKISSVLLNSHPLTEMASQSYEWPCNDGILTVWESLQVEDVQLKSKLTQSLYAHVNIDFLECPLFENEDLYECYQPKSLARQVRLCAHGAENRMNQCDGIRVPSFVNAMCSPDFLLSQSPGKHAETVYFLQKVVGYATGDGDRKNSYDFCGLVTFWFNDLVRNALMLGHDPEAVIAGARIIIGAYTDYMLGGRALDEEDGELVRETTAQFERQALINALSPFPQAVALMNPTKEDFFPSARSLPSSTVSIEGPYISNLFHGAPGCAISFLLRTMQALDMPFEIEDITHLKAGRKVLLQDYLEVKEGKSPEVEQWFIKHHKTVDLYEFNKLLNGFSHLSLADETLEHIHRYRAHAYVFNRSEFVRLAPPVYFREGQEKIAIDVLLQHNSLDMRAVRDLGLSSEGLRPYVGQLGNDIRRHLLGEDLGL